MNKPLISIALRNPTLSCFIVGRSYLLKLNALRSQARRPCYISKVQKQTSFALKSLSAFVIAGLIFALTPILMAQEKPKPFEGPAVAKMPENCSFELSLKTATVIALEKWYAANPDAPKRKARNTHQIVKWIINKAGPTIQVKTTDEGERYGEFWIINGALITKEKKSEDYWALLPHETQEMEGMVFAGDLFPNTDWINVNNFFKKTKFDGKEALEFGIGINQDKNTRSASYPLPEAQPGFTRAFVDAASRFPLYIEKDGNQYTYKHLTLFSIKLVVPDAVKVAYEREQTRQNILNAPPARP